MVATAECFPKVLDAQKRMSGSVAVYPKPQYLGSHTEVSNNRYYNPRHGRFINRDPIEEMGGVNLYAYCSNNPVNGYDLLGCVEQDELPEDVRSHWTDYAGIPGDEAQITLQDYVNQGGDYRQWMSWLNSGSSNGFDRPYSGFGAVSVTFGGIQIDTIDRWNDERYGGALDAVQDGGRPQRENRGLASNSDGWFSDGTVPWVSRSGEARDSGRAAGNLFKSSMWIGRDFAPDEMSHRDLPTYAINAKTGQFVKLGVGLYGMHDDTLGIGLGLAGGKVAGGVLGAIWGRIFGRSATAATQGAGVLADAGESSLGDAIMLQQKHAGMIGRLMEGDVPMPSGAASGKMMGELTTATGREVALLRVDGVRILRLGTSDGVFAGDASRVIAHTHPSGILKFSNFGFEGGAPLGDIPSFQTFQPNQVTSVLISPSGQGVRLPIPQQ